MLRREAEEGRGNARSNYYKRPYSYLKVLELGRLGSSCDELAKVVKGEIGYAPLNCSVLRWLRAQLRR